MPFRDKIDAGRRLTQALARFEDDHPIIFALPRGGVPVAAQIARGLSAPLDLVIARKIGVPFQPELAMGAVVDGRHPLTVRNEDIIRGARVSEEEFRIVRDQELAEIRRRRVRYLGHRPHPELKGRVVILVDDGIATGATILAALRAVKEREPRRLVLAVPVAPTSTLRQLRDEADEIVCLEAHEDFDAIGLYYVDFGQVADEAVIQCLAEAEVGQRSLVRGSR